MKIEITINEKALGTSRAQRDISTENTNNVTVEISYTGLPLLSIQPSCLSAIHEKAVELVQLIEINNLIRVTDTQV